MLSLLRILLVILVFCLLFLETLKTRLRLTLWAWNIPGPLSFPILGCAHRFICHREELFDRVRLILKEFPGSVTKVWIGPKLLVLLREPEFIEKVYESNKMTKKDSLMDVAKPFVGEGLITSNGAKWRAHRKIISPTLTPKAVESFCEIFNNNARKMVDNVAKKGLGKVVDLEDFFHPCSILIVCESLLGLQITGDDCIKHEFMDACIRGYLVVIEKLMKPWLQNDWLFPLFPIAKEEKAATSTMRNYLLKEIRRKRSDKIKKGFLNPMDEMIEALEKGEITEIEVIDEIATLFTASTDTTTTVSNFCLTMIAMHPEYQKTVHEEIDTVVGKFGDELDSSICTEFQFLERCIKETLRLFPIAPFLVRSVEEDFELTDNFVLPKGATACLSNYSVQRDPRFWEKPEEFHPDHFLPEFVSKRPAGCYNPFSGGIRMCLGRHFALLCIKILLVHFLRKYKVTYAGPKVSVKNLPLFSDITIRMKGGFKMIIEPRN